MRPDLSSWLSLLLPLLAACGDDPLDQLAEEAADCPLSPPVHLGDAPSTSVLLNAYYLQDEAAQDVRKGLAESQAVEEVFSKASALGAWGVRTLAFNDAVS